MFMTTANEGDETLGVLNLLVDPLEFEGIGAFVVT